MEQKERLIRLREEYVKSKRGYEELYQYRFKDLYDEIIKLSIDIKDAINLSDLSESTKIYASLGRNSHFVNGVIYFSDNEVSFVSLDSYDQDFNGTLELERIEISEKFKEPIEILEKNLKIIGFKKPIVNFKFFDPETKEMYIYLEFDDESNFYGAEFKVEYLKLFRKMTDGIYEDTVSFSRFYEKNSNNKMTNFSDVPHQNTKNICVYMKFNHFINQH